MWTPSQPLTALRSMQVWSFALGLGVASCIVAASINGLSTEASLQLLPGANGTEVTQLPSWPGDAASIADLQNADMRLLYLLAGALGILLLLATLLNEAVALLIEGVGSRLPLAIQSSLGAGRTQLSKRLGMRVLRRGTAGMLAALPITIGFWLAMRATWPAGDTGDRFPTLVVAWLVASLLIALMLLALLLSQTSPRLIQRAFGLLRSGTRATASPWEVLSRSTVAVVQVASATIVIGTAVVLLRAFGPAAPVERELPPAGDDTLMFQMDLQHSAPWQADPQGTIQRLFDDLRLLPDFAAVSASSQGAVLGLGEVRRVTTVCPECFRGTMPRMINSGDARLQVVTSDFARTIGFEEVDGMTRAGPREVVVNRALAYQLFPNGDPVGKPLRFGERPERWLEVVGVIPNVMEPGIGSPGEAPPAIYLAAEQHPAALRNLLVRFNGNADGYIPLVEDSLRKFGIESTWAGTLNDLRREFRAPLRWFSGVFATLALTVALIAAMGVHRTMHFLAEQRSREIGVRLALGATGAQIRRLIVSSGVRLSALGAYLGVIFLGGIARMLELRFAGARLVDPALYLWLPIGLTLLAVAASWGASTRAASRQPGESMA